MTASVIIGIVALILTTCLCVLIAVKLSTALSNALSLVETMSKRNTEHVDTLLDRLMTVNWESYAALRATEDSIEGGFIGPEDEEEEGQVLAPSPWGSLRALGERLNPNREEQELLNEDFDEEDVPRRADSS